MLADNSLVYILYSLLLIFSMFVYLFMCARTLSGYDIVGKNKIENEQLEKILRVLLSMVFIVMLMVAVIGFPHVLLDVPEYLSGTGETVTGTITEFTDKMRPVEDDWALVSAEIQDENTGKIVSIKKTYFPYAQVGDQVKISYLRHCKMGMVQEVNGMPDILEPKADKGFYIAVMILLHMYFIARMLLVLKEQIKPGKRYKVHIHKGRCIAWIFAAEMINAWGSIILAAAMMGKCNTPAKIIWDVLIVIFFIPVFGLLMEDHYIFKVNRKRIFYCDWKINYLGSPSEIKGVERTGKQIDVVLENGTRLPVYDIEERENM